MLPALYLKNCLERLLIDLFVSLVPFQGECHVPGEHLSEPLRARLPLPPLQPPLHPASDSGHLPADLALGTFTGLPPCLRRGRLIPLQPQRPHLLLGHGQGVLLPQDRRPPALRDPRSVRGVLQPRHHEDLEEAEHGSDQPLPLGQEGGEEAEETGRQVEGRWLKEGEEWKACGN